MVGGLEYRIIRGRKGEGDRILEMRTRGGDWCWVTMPQTYIMADFLYQNEERLKLALPHYKSGGGMYKWALIDAIRSGWEVPTERLKKQKEAKLRRV